MIHTFIAKPKGEASNRDALSFRVGMYVCISTACAMQFYAFVCISATLAQYNSMLMYYVLCISVTLAQCLRNNEVKMCPKGRLQSVWKQVRTASANCKLFGCLAAYIALTAALVCYAKDKGAIHRFNITRLFKSAF